MGTTLGGLYSVGRKKSQGGGWGYVQCDQSIVLEIAPPPRDYYAKIDNCNALVHLRGLNIIGDCYLLSELRPTLSKV